MNSNTLEEKKKKKNKLVGHSYWTEEEGDVDLTYNDPPARRHISQSREIILAWDTFFRGKIWVPSFSSHGGHWNRSSWELHDQVKDEGVADKILEKIKGIWILLITLQTPWRSPMMSCWRHLAKSSPNWPKGTCSIPHVSVTNMPPCAWLCA